MSKSIVLNGDMSTGHDGFPPTKAVASSSVTINGISIVVEGDSYEQHCKGGCHVPVAIGSSNITINGKKIIVDGDSLSCGDTATASSSITIS
jgi:uncharacterized Zn-binding protein involved in type VI secretion